jgi:TFIIF-interacting CTD phosphatase-like protein
MSTNKSIFLVAYYFMRPQAKARTQVKGWMQTEKNMQFDEQVAVTRRLKTSDQTTAKVILDLSKKSVVRNGWGSTEAFDELFKYFHASYPKYTTEVMATLDPAYLERINAEMAPPAETVESPESTNTSISSTSGSSISSAV